MGRTLVPLHALRKIAEKLIMTDTRKRTANWRPKSKVSALRELIRTDPELYGRAVAMFKQMQLDDLKAELEKSGISVRPTNPVAQADGPLSPELQELCESYDREHNITETYLQESAPPCQNCKKKALYRADGRDVCWYHLYRPAEIPEEPAR